MNNEWIKFFVRGAAITIALLVLTSLAPQTIASIDRAFLSTEFRVRGERAVDSSVVILYFSSDDLSILGDLPLKRSYYALLVNALNELGAGAIGFDIGFTEEDKEHNEYDKLLCSVVKKSGKVIVSGYFRSLPGDKAVSTPAIPDNLSLPLHASEDLLYGNQPEFPFQALLGSAAGFGHTNFDDYYRIPLLINYGNQVVPSFFLDVLRVYEGAPGSGVSFSGNTLAISSSPHSIVIPTNKQSKVTINYSGKFRGLPVYPVIQFLKAYDTLKMGGSPALQISNIKGKIVLIGIIAEGRSAFIPTPFESQFPSIGIHAIAIHNSVDGSFLSFFPPFAEYLVALFIGICCTLLLQNVKLRSGVLGIASIVLLLLVVSFILFLQMNLFVPLARNLITAFGVTLTLLILRHQQVQNQLHALTTERSSIVNQLEEKEAILAALEKELNETDRTDNGERRMNLVEDVKRFKAQIQHLKAKAGEEQPAELDAAPSSGTAKDFYGIIYHSSGPMAPIIDFVTMIANNDAPVLILGESGTGKELVARGIHQLCSRKEKPFIAVNCGALTETLLESELFGHEKGAFTGAVKDKPGRFELADGGTIFLDEIGETSEAFQVKLLRVIQEGVFDRVGGVETKHVNVRVITATNRDIKKEVEAKVFREDLYYRLNVFTVQLPPLRERTLDLPLIINALITKESLEMKVSIGALDVLQKYEWKGNIRELQSVIKRAVIVARADNRSIIHVKDLPAELCARSTVSTNIEEKIMELLRRKQFSRSAISETAAELGGLNRGTVSEYFRGECFRIFVEHQWDVKRAAEAIAGTSQAEVVEKVEKKLTEFLRNIIENVDFSASLEEIKTASKPKYKNLALRYHTYLDAIIDAFFHNKWSIE
jgi:transcriptional regulator with GAF, ATPase, and Fis domain/CHASE2 domain-containing sensor protein